MERVILDKQAAEILARLVRKEERLTKRASDILWSLVLHSGALLPPFYDDWIYEAISPLVKAGLVTIQPHDSWRSFRRELSIFLRDTVKYDNALDVRYEPTGRLDVVEGHSDIRGFQTYGLRQGRITESARSAESYLSRNVTGMYPLIKRLAKSWDTGLSQAEISLMSTLYVPLFARNIAFAPNSVVSSDDFWLGFGAWFSAAKHDLTTDFVDHNFDVLRSSGLTTLDDAEAELKRCFSLSFKYFCRKRRLSVSSRWSEASVGQERFEKALREYLQETAQGIRLETKAFATFWQFVTQTMYLVSEAERNGNPICADTGRLDGIPGNLDSSDDYLAVVRVMQRDHLSFPRISTIEHAMKLVDDRNVQALRERVWEWKHELIEAQPHHVDRLSKAIRKDLEVFRDLPRYRAMSGFWNVLAIPFSVLDLITGGCSSVAFIPIGIYYQLKVSGLEKRTQWCLVGSG
jgi:hypothetical protein